MDETYKTDVKSIPPTISKNDEDLKIFAGLLDRLESRLSDMLLEQEPKEVLKGDGVRMSDFRYSLKLKLDRLDDIIDRIDA
jgi:hypothetical protein